MTEFNFEQHENDHAKALQEELKAKERHDTVQKAWDAKLAKLLAADTGLSELKANLDKTASMYSDAKAKTKQLRSEAKAALEKDFITELPGGYGQNEGKSIAIKNRQQFFINCLSLGGSDFLKIDDEAVQNLTKLAKKDSKTKEWTLDHKATWLFGCELRILPKAQISDSWLKTKEITVPDEPIAEIKTQMSLVSTDADKEQIPLEDITF